METTCPICKRRLEAHDNGQMAECRLDLMQRDYGWRYTEDFVWMCPGCDGKIDDHDDAVLGLLPACWCWETIPTASLWDEPRGALPALD